MKVPSRKETWIRVLSVEEDSPAEKSGLRKDDILHSIKMNKRSVKISRLNYWFYETIAPDKDIQLRIMRNNKPHIIRYKTRGKIKQSKKKNQ